MCLAASRTASGIRCAPSACRVQERMPGPGDGSSAAAAARGSDQKTVRVHAVPSCSEERTAPLPSRRVPRNHPVEHAAASRTRVHHPVSSRA